MDLIALLLFLKIRLSLSRFGQWIPDRPMGIQPQAALRIHTVLFPLVVYRFMKILAKACLIL